MQQLILDVDGFNVALPETQKGGYAIEKEPLSVSVEMVTGRQVLELKGFVWVISYQYGYFDDDMKNKVIAACNKGQRTPIICGYLTQQSDGTLEYSNFFVTKFTRPKFMWSRSDNGVSVPLWGDFSLELREVEPND